ncbi:MAG: F0F1 ATP synthase subunit B [Sulfurovum sp.]|nr:MAG: F0F1 ATP synthase subunit B [Sulfurovum sp.]
MNLKKALWFFLFLIPAIALANAADAEGSRYFAQTGRETDFWPRVINFTIFAALLYYLIADPIKKFFVGRKESIANKLNEIEEMLQVAKEKKKEAQTRLEESEKKAKEILKDAKKEAALLARKIAESSENELQLLEKQYAEKKMAEERKTVRETVKEVLGENITPDDIALDAEKAVDIIAKKVA